MEEERSGKWRRGRWRGVENRGGGGGEELRIDKVDMDRSGERRKRREEAK